MADKRSVTRRTFLGAAGGLAATSLTGTYAGAALANPPLGTPSGTAWRTVPPGKLAIQLSRSGTRSPATRIPSSTRRPVRTM